MKKKDNIETCSQTRSNKIPCEKSMTFKKKPKRTINRRERVNNTTNDFSLPITTDDVPSTHKEVEQNLELKFREHDIEK